MGSGIPTCEAIDSCVMRQLPREPVRDDHVCRSSANARDTQMRFKSIRRYIVLHSLPCRVYILHMLLPIQDQSQQRAKQTLDLRTRYGVHNASFDVLRSEMGCLAGEGFLESRSEHYNELASKVSERVPGVAHASRARHLVFEASATHCNVGVVC